MAHGSVGSSRRDRRAWRFLGTGSVAVVLSIVIAFSIGGNDEPAAEPVLPVSTTTTSTSTSTSTSSTTLPPADPNTHVIAAVIGPEIDVLAEIPAEIATLVAVARTDRTIWAPYSPERAGAPAIPTIDDQVQGRHRTETGWAFANPTSIGGPATFLVTEERGEWLRVLLPVRPNGTEGWIRAAEVTLSTTHLRIEVRVGARTVKLFDGPSPVLEAPVVVGRGSSPTPTGRFFATDTITKHGGSYGTGVLALSAYSQALDRFSDGVPVVALHGTNRPDLLGQAASNGCIRMANETIDRLRASVSLGTPVDVLP